MPALPNPSSRRSRKGREGGLRTLSAVPAVDVPVWPLPADASQEAKLEQGRDRVAQLQADLEAEDDRRKTYRLRRMLEREQLELGIVELQLEQAADAEAAFWADLWAAPQAAMWAENPAAQREVALYVRWMVRAGQGDTKAAAEARALSDRLGINPAALLKLRAEIENVDAAEDRGRRRRQRREPDAGETASAAPDEGTPENDPRAGLWAV